MVTYLIVGSRESRFYLNSVHYVEAIFQLKITEWESFQLSYKKHSGKNQFTFSLFLLIMYIWHLQIFPREQNELSVYSRAVFCISCLALFSVYCQIMTFKLQAMFFLSKGLMLSHKYHNENKMNGLLKLYLDL